MARPLPSGTLGIVSPHVAATRFTLSRFAPSPALAGLVDRYWIVRWDLRGESPFVQEVLPNPHANFAVEEGLTRAYGVRTKRSAKELRGLGQAFGIKLRVGALHAYLRAATPTSIDRSIPLHRALGATRKEVLSVEHEVLATTDPDAQIRAVEALLLAHLPAADPRIDEVAETVALATTRPEIVSTRALAEAAGLEVRTLQRLFRSYVGVSPKKVLRQLRMQEAADRAAHGVGVDWAGLASDLGYADQAHLIRDFRAQIGTTPAKYAAREQRSRESTQSSP